MTTIRFAVPVLALAALLTPGAAGHPRAPQAAAIAVPAASQRARAIGVPGLGALTAGGNGVVNWVSCRSAGNCAAVGNYIDSSNHQQGFVVSERNGVWGRAIGVPGLGALNAGGIAVVGSVSCGSAGNCAAVGDYTDSSNHQQGFVVSERNGVWGQAIEVPGLGLLNTAGPAVVKSVSCGSAGNCAAGGSYMGPGGENQQGFVVGQRNGVWGKAIEVPGLAALNALGFAEVNSVSCASAGNCTAGGDYTPPHSGVDSVPFVASERHGVWGRAIEVPGGAVVSVSCNSAGYCAAVEQGSLLSERHGKWRETLGPGPVVSVSCASAGYCAAGGSYQDPTNNQQGFVVSLRNGVWRRPFGVPGLRTLNVSGKAIVLSVSCASAGNCAVGGQYLDRVRHYQGFVVGERDGVWRRAFEVPGLGALNEDGNAQVSSVSCALAGNCAAVGNYTDPSGHVQGFVVSQRSGVWRRAFEVPGLAALEREPVR